MGRYRKSVTRKSRSRSKAGAPPSARTIKVKPHTRGPRAPNHGQKRKKQVIQPHAQHVAGYKRAKPKQTR
jgi:hypothetical protein